MLLVLASIWNSAIHEPWVTHWVSAYVNTRGHNLKKTTTITTTRRRKPTLKQQQTSNNKRTPSRTKAERGTELYLLSASRSLEHPCNHWMVCSLTSQVGAGSIGWWTHWRNKKGGVIWMVTSLTSYCGRGLKNQRHAYWIVVRRLDGWRIVSLKDVFFLFFYRINLRLAQFRRQVVWHFYSSLASARCKRCLLEAAWWIAVLFFSCDGKLCKCRFKHLYYHKEDVF